MQFTYGGRDVMIVQNSMIGRQYGQMWRSVHQNSIRNSVDEGGNNGPAAVFQESSNREKPKEMNPLVESIMNVKEQISKVKSDEDMDKSIQKELLKSLQEQLRDMEQQLSKQQMEEHQNAVNQQNRHKKKEEPEQSNLMRNDLESGVVLSSAVSLEHIERHQKTSEVLERQIERRDEQINWMIDFQRRVPEQDPMPPIMYDRIAQVDRMRDKLQLGDIIEEKLVDEKAKAEQSDGES